MPELTIRLTKHADGRPVLTCMRADGSVTRQRYTEANARFFARHDLTHYAVETGFGHTRGFYGLVADGWNHGDFGAPWPRGRLPADPDLSENIVGLFDAERATGRRWTSAGFNAALAQAQSAHPGCAAPRPVSDAQLDRIRGELARLFHAWDILPAGETLELAFDRAMLVSTR